MATRFLEHFAYIATAAREQALWDESDGFFHDVISTPDGQRTPIRVRSLVGLLPMIATTRLGIGTLRRLPSFAACLDWFLAHRPEYAEALSFTHVRDGATGIPRRSGVRAGRVTNRGVRRKLQLAGARLAARERHAHPGATSIRAPVWR